MKKYWFALKSHIYVDFKEQNMLLYNTHTGDKVETAQSEMITLVRQIYEPINLGVIEIDSIELDNPSMGSFINMIVDMGMAYLIEKRDSVRKPIQLIPILNLQKDIEKYKDDKDKLLFFEKNISKYLFEINLYLNESCSLSCKYCSTYAKQIHCCIASIDKKEMSINSLKNVFQQLQFTNLKSINILGGNILEYSYLDELEKILTNYPKDIYFYVHYKNYKKHSLLESQWLNLIINFPIDEDSFRKVWITVNQNNTKLHFIVENEDNYKLAEILIKKFGVENYIFIPHFTGKNIDFFKENIYMEKEDIFYKTFEMREIFKNKKVNSNFFGTLYVLPDGIIKANMNTAPIGNINADKILNTIQYELINNTAWRKIRNSEPCNECLYQFICPPLSNYETAIGQNNLCYLNEIVK